MTTEVDFIGNSMREAEVHLPDDGLEECGLQNFMSVCREAQIRNVMELLSQQDGYLWVVTVATPLNEERLANLEVVDWYERLSTPSQDTTYLCKIKSPAEDSVEPAEEKDISKGEMRVHADGIDVSLVGPQSDISQSIEEYENAGLNIVLQKITDYTGPDDPLGSVTARQQDVLTTALDIGYFEVPRNATTEDIAAELDLDPSTVREHLQRAQQNIMRDLLTST